MRIRNGATWLLSAGFMVALAPLTLHAQSTATTGNGTSSTASTSASSSGGGSGGGSTGITANSGINLNAASTLVQPVAISSITNNSASATGIPSTANILANTYANPYSLGMPSKYASNLGPPSKYQATMGQGLYINNSTTTASTTGSTTTNAGQGFNTMPTPRSPSYSTVLGGGLKARQYDSSKVAEELKAKFARSTAFQNNKAIQIQVAKGIVTLSGQVADDEERIRAESLVRMAMGVEDVQNNLQVTTVASARNEP